MTKFVKNLSADQFNTLYPVGSQFVYYSRKGDAQGKPCVTRSEAWTLGHGETVVSISGIAGGIAVTHLSHVSER